MRRHDAVAVAVSAFKKFPFYQWLYQDLRKEDPNSWKYDTLPILTKDKIFEYENNTGQPYDSSTQLANPQTWVTSGTLGRPLRVDWSVEEVQKNTAWPVIVELEKMIDLAAFMLIEAFS